MYTMDSFLPMFVFLTSFAQAYGEGSYGTGEYNDDTPTATSPSPSPAQSGSTSTSTTQVSEGPIATDDQPISSTDEQPRTTTTQPTKQNDIASETVSNAGMDPLWMLLIAAGIIIAILTTMFAIRKNRHN